MTIKTIDIKAGSIKLTANYTWIRRMWAKLTRKQLPYNDFMAFPKDIILPACDTNGVIVEPIKKYSRAESDTMSGCLTLTFGALEDADLFATINIVRPGTFPGTSANLDRLLTSKYYRTRDLSDATEYDEYIY